MSYSVHGELSADGKDIVVVFGGAPYAVKPAVKKMALLTPLIKKSDPPGALVMPLSWPACVQLAFTFGEAWTPHARLQAWILAQTAIRCGYLGKELRYQCPEGLSLYWWQVEDAKMVAHCAGGAITDDPGLGKTVSAVVGMVERSLWDYPVLPIVAVVPPGSMVESWVRAFKRWAPQWRTVAWAGTPRQREGLIGTADVYIVSYATARVDAKPGNSLAKSPLMRIKPLSVIADECHAAKNPDAVQTRALARIVSGAHTFIPMSGTPISHNVMNMHPVLKMLEPGAWPASERMQPRYTLEVASEYGQSEIIGLNPAHEAEFRTALLGRFIHHSKETCLKDLPPKVYTLREVELPADYLKSYQDMEDKMLATLPDGQEVSVTSTLTKILRLQQLAASAADVEYYWEFSEKVQDWVEKQRVTLRMPSWKVEELRRVLDERRNQQCIVFAPSRQLIELAATAAEADGLRVGRVMGGQNIGKERTPAIDAFQAGELDLMCVVSSAGGVGLTLTGKRLTTEIFLQRPYKLDESIQCEDRGYGRVDGSELKSIEIVDIWAKDTIDFRIPDVLYSKATQLGELLQDTTIVRELFGGNRHKPAKRRSGAGATPKLKLMETPAAHDALAMLGAMSR